MVKIQNTRWETPVGIRVGLLADGVIHLGEDGFPGLRRGDKRSPE